MSETRRDWSRFALLVIDLQRDFWPEKLACCFPEFPGRIRQLLELCRGEGIEVVHLRAAFQPDGSDWMVRYRLRGRIPCVRGTPGVEPLPFAMEAADEAVIVKQSFDGFCNPELLEHLQQNGRQFLLVAGLLTSTCVLLTAASAAQLGFLAAVVDDGCADEPSAHAQTLERYQFIFDRTTVADITERYAAWREDLERLDALASGGPA